MVSASLEIINIPYIYEAIYELNVLYILYKLRRRPGVFIRNFQALLKLLS